MRQVIRATRAGIVGVLLAAAASPVVATEESGPQQRIEGRLEKAGLNRDAAIAVVVQSDHAVLTGTVPTVAAQREAQRLALREARTIENRLTVTPVERAEADLAKDIRKAVLGYPYYTVFDHVDFRIEAGTVVLGGSVREPLRRDDIEGRVAEVPGLSGLRNEITVQPVSFFDDQIRRQLVRAIYGRGPLGIAAHRPDPPVHILVENGRVTLTGWVATPLERTLVTHAALGVTSFGVESRVQVDVRPDKKTKPKQT